MERLDTLVRPKNSNVEAAIHFARYAMALAHSRGKRVLDVACGEGYGARLLKDAGAAHVDGVDISAAAIDRARQAHGGEGIAFHCADASQLDELFGTATFDLVVSLETIEHLQDPETFLRALRRVARENAVIILSCPNDHWYYPEDHGNPHHVRKFTFSEFRDMTTRVLGPARWALGSPVLGFGTAPLNESSDFWKPLGSSSWLLYHPTNGLLVPAAPDDPIKVESCSYFVGFWGLTSPVAGAAFFPMSMDRYAALTGASDVLQRLRESATERDALVAASAALSAERDELRRLNASLHLEAQKYRVQAAALLKESDLLRESLVTRTTERDQAVAACNQITADYNQAIAAYNRVTAERDAIWEAARRWYTLTGRVRRLLPGLIDVWVRRVARRLVS